MELKDIKIEAEKIFKDIQLNGIKTIRELYSEGEDLSKRLQFDPVQEYLKKIIISQIDVTKLLLDRHNESSTQESISEFKDKSKKICDQIVIDENLNFDTNMINTLFGNSLDIKSIEEYKGLTNLIFGGAYEGNTYYSIFEEEQFKYDYERGNIFKKLFQYFRYNKMKKGNLLESADIKKVRDIFRREILNNPEKPKVSLNNILNLLEKGIREYQSVKEVEDISRMTLIPFINQNSKGPIKIEEMCKLFRTEMSNIIGTTTIGTDYRKRAVTIGTDRGLNKGPVIETPNFEEIPQKMQNLQEQYEVLYNLEQSPEEYIKGATKIFLDFIYIQPYEDGNKRTSISLLNSMLISKGIIPPVISLVNDEEMIEVFRETEKGDYSQIQELLVKKCLDIKNSNNSINEERHKNLQREGL